ncbi:MAG: PAC2 family protein [Gemmataceae bacterium]
MADNPFKLNRPWLVAVWPGMGHVALNAGIYLLSKLEMTVVAEYDAGDLFEVEQVEVKGGLIQAGRPPRNRFFVWQDPAGKHDLVVFLGEAQPPIGKYPFCRQLIRLAKEHGIEKVFTFAAMATGMSHTDPSRVFAAATDQTTLEELKRLELNLLEDGNIGGLNGVLLGAAAEAGLPGACLLGEMPHIFARLPFPKASRAILDVFATMAGLDLDLSPLDEQVAEVDRQLGELLERARQASEGESTDEDEGDEDEDEGANGAGEGSPTASDRIRQQQAERIDILFAAARQDRAKAFELKQELDRLGRFAEYEDRFLDLFKKPAE